MVASGSGLSEQFRKAADRSIRTAHHWHRDGGPDIIRPTSNQSNERSASILRRLIHLATIVIALLLPGRAFAAERPNIVLILADDVGCEPIGAYGGERWETPNVDALATGGLKFDYCFSMPVCHPSRMALMTGRYPFRTNAKWGSFPKNEERHSIGSVLKQSGYRTAVAGKWQLSLMKKDVDQPKRMGFDEWSLFGWHEGARYHDPFIYENGTLRTDTSDKYGPDLYVEFLARFMERSVKQNEPFFAYYSMALAHDVTDDIPDQVPYVPGKDRWMNYGEMIASMDDMVGRVVAKVDELGIRNNTVILFTGDNGTAARSKLRHISGRRYEYESVYSIRRGEKIPGGKGSLKDTGTNVPLIANWPNHIPAGTTSDAIVDFSDWLPTVAEIAGATHRENLDGISFATQLSDPDSQSQRTFAFAESRNGKAWVRNQRYKMYNDGRVFDVSADRKEKSPIRKPFKDSVGVVVEQLQSNLRSLNYDQK